ncbi:MAG: contractile injection system tape measure protein, partial [Arenibacter sp.]|nr:contractile injection system tape measure protein [Arenibacter sp.]
MSSVDKHSIKQQVLDINIANVDDQEEVAMAISKVYKESIEAILSDICENLIPDNEVVRIDTMTIDIGHLAFNRLESEFPKAVKKALKEKLFHQIRDKKVSPVPSKKAVRQNVKNTLLYYLNTGQLPWNYEGGLPELQSDFSSKELVAMPQLLRILENVEARKRAVRFFSEKQLSDFLYKYFPMSKKAVLDELPLFKGCLSKLGRPMPLADTSIAKTAKGLLDDLKTDGLVRMWVMEQLLEQLVYQSDASRMRLIQLLPTTYRKSVVALLKSVDWKRGDLFSKEERQLMETLVALHQSRSQTATRGRPVRKKMVTPKELPMENGIVINNAGLILVWPYLEAFFTGLGLMKEQLFQDEKA